MKAEPNHTPNRALQRAALKGLPKGGDELFGWVEVDLEHLSQNILSRLARNGYCRPERGWRSNQLSVQQYSPFAGQSELVVARLSVRRHDGARLREHWRTMQRIKELTFPGHEALEVYPPPSELVDDAPMWHLWVLAAGASFGVSLHGDRI